MSKINSNLSNNLFYFGIIFLAAVVVILPIAVYGIPDGHDLAQHFQFANAYYDSLTTGDGFPSWSARENDGYGSIGIRFYPPLAYYVMALFRIVSGNWFDAAWLTFSFWMILGCFGVYFWSRQWLSPKIAAIAAVFYAFIPYHLNQIYISFIYADFAGAAILPFCFAFQTKVFRRGENTDVLGLAFFYALLILTHLPSAIIGSICLAVYGLILLEKKNAVRQIIKSSIAAVLGLAASSYYWAAVVSEMSWLNHATEEYQSGHFDFARGFFPSILHRVDKYNVTNPVLTDSINSFCLLFLATAIVYLFYRRIKNAEKSIASQVYRTVLPLGLFAFFMTTILSYPVWKIITPLQKIQFPMRFMSVIVMCGTIVTATAVHFMIEGNFFKKRNWMYASVIFITMLSVIDIAYIFDPSAFAAIERTRFEAQMRELPEKQNHQFWWSTWSKENALDVKEKVFAEDRQTSVTNWSAEKRNFTVEPGMPINVRIATFYYPHWKAEVNGKLVNIEKNVDGAMLIPISGEKSEVAIYFQESSIVKIACIFSILTWLGIFLTFVLLRRRSFLPLKESQPRFTEEFTF